MLIGGGAAFAAPTEPSCCHCGRGPRFSCLPISFFVLLALAAAILTLLSWTAALMCYLPIFSIFYFVYVKRLRPALLAGAPAGSLFPVFLPHNLDDLFARMMASGYVPATLLAGVMGFIPSLIFFEVCLGATVRAAMPDGSLDPLAPAGTFSFSGAPGWVPYTLLNSFITVGFFGELAKYLVVVCGCCVACCAQVADPRPREHALRTIALLLAVALGFAAAEGFSLGVIAFASNRLHDSVRLLLSAPLHCVAAAFTGLRLSVRGQQARQRDLDALSAGQGREQFVLLASGATVRVVAANAPPTGAEGVFVDTTAPPPQQQQQQPPQRAIVVWSWARVLWPAAVISGCFHFFLCVGGGGRLASRLCAP